MRTAIAFFLLATVSLFATIPEAKLSLSLGQPQEFTLPNNKKLKIDGDFVNGKLSYDLPKSSYAPGLISSPLHFWLPKMVSRRLQEGFRTFGRNAHGFLTNEAVLIAVETRTSSPVRIIRDRETLQHVRIQGLFPCGEGAGYAGGIVSAGVDGERCAEQCAQWLKGED